MATSFAFRIGLQMIVLSSCMTATAALPEGLIDPTRPLGFITTHQGGSSDLVLTSIMITGKNRIAVINGQRVEENQQIGDARAIRILPGRVILRRGDRNEVLTLHQNDVKQPIGQKN
ncbi:MAG: hypothetical protein IIB71_00930 [Proteobacteria bacterium]|nr:hypothetical protein [Pseudomonadota bacterium]